MAFSKKNKPVIILLLILFGFSSLPANDFGQKIYPVDGDVWERIEILYLEQGLAPPSNSGPWSKEELVKMVDRINPGELSKAGESVYDLLIEELYSQPKLSSDAGFGITAGLNVALEGYYHTNGEDFNDDTDWTYGFEEREKLISAPIEIWLGENIYSYWEPFIGTTRYGEEDDVEGPEAIYGQDLYNNIVLLDASNIDLTFPYRAFAAVGGDFWNLAFGRDILSWGAGHTGNMVLGDHHDYYESIRFTAFFEYFKYTYVVAGFDHSDWDGSQNDEPTGLQMFVGHRMETRFWDKLKFTLDEEAMMNFTWPDDEADDDASYAGFDFRYLNPMMIYHNTYNRGIANSILSLEVEYTPWKYFSIYGQYAIDEFQTAEEQENHPDSNPGAVGIIAGIEGVYPLGPGYLTSYFEFAKTDPYMYLRDNVDYIVYRRQFNIDTNVEQDVKFLGYEEGPDAMVFELNICYKVRDVWEAGLTGSYLLHGENDAETEWSTGEESNSAETPSGIAEKTFTLTLSGEYNIPLFKDQEVSIYGEADYITSENFKNEDGNDTNDIQLVLGVKYSL